MMIDLSLICVYNNKESLDDALLKSLKTQSVQPELILVDNRNNIYKSAASALNAGAKIATKRFFLFVHQDIMFMREDDLENLYETLCKDELKVLGLAGVIVKKKGVYSNMLHGNQQLPAGTNHIDALFQVDVLDECLIACSRGVYSNIKFDEKICNGWDLYGVDFCLQAKKSGIKVCVIPNTIWHLSPGHPKHSFYDCARRMRKKYNNIFPYIQTCCITIPVSTKWYGSSVLYLLEILNYFRGKL